MRGSDVIVFQELARELGPVMVAILLALPFAKPTLAHIETWKIILGIAGLIIFVRAGMTRA